MLNRFALIAAFVLVLPGPALAIKDHKSAAHLNIEKSPFDEQRSAIEMEFTAGGTYSEISHADRSAVIQALDRMESILKERSVDQLNQREKVELFNAQEIVNAKLTLASDDSRLVCRRERIPGSHIRTNICFTVAERRRMQERDAQGLRDAQARPSQSDEK
ncbi:hypothetical protein OS187_00145 [Xanthomonadaceae bacterium JHOS43]|nr:hypothetical protein [Xanthomonadaceae bacterium JHOS43]MCX7563883.1 hypothetical protein [Xanthomonadaceae bacterium XH05]